MLGPLGISGLIHIKVLHVAAAATALRSPDCVGYATVGKACYPYANFRRGFVAPDLIGELMGLTRSVGIALLFTTAGAILAVHRPRWRGSWLLLGGAIVSSTLAGFRLLGIFSPDGNVWIAVGYEAFETLSYLLSGVGILLVSMRARADAS